MNKSRIAGRAGLSLGLALALILSAIIHQSCSNRDSVFIKFADIAQFLTRENETRFIDFGAKDQSDEKYLAKGWGPSEEERDSGKTFRWALGRESSLLVYFADLVDRSLKIECRPFQRPGEPPQECDIYANDQFLRKMIFAQNGTYDLNIPAALARLGSNQIRFAWKYPRAPKAIGLSQDERMLTVEFFELSFADERLPAPIEAGGSKISVIRDGQRSLIALPPGGLVEYFLELPEKPMLTFILFANAEPKPDSGITLAIYDDKGRSDVRKLKAGYRDRNEEYRFDLGRFAGEPVKIVLSNSFRNDPRDIVYWGEPAIFFSSKKGAPAFWESVRDSTLRSPAPRVKPRPNKPDIFIYLVDTLRADHLSCYGYGRKTTPRLDDFAKDGILFEKCFANASWTKPAVGSILTGLTPGKHRAEGRNDLLPGEVSTISEILKSQGYSTLHLTSNPYTAEEFNFRQGSDVYFWDHSGKISSESLNDALFQLFTKRPDLRKNPIFAYIHTVDPHSPYTPSEPFLGFTKADPARETLVFADRIYAKQNQGGLTAEDIDFIISKYDGEIQQNDYFFGAFMDFLKSEGRYDPSLIIFLSDHGEQFHEHGKFFHGYSIYNEEIHIPLIVKLPGQEFSGSRSSRWVSQVDILPTVLDYLGIEIPAEVDGSDILERWDTGGQEKPILVKEYLDGESFIGFITPADQMKYIATCRTGDGGEVLASEIYDLKRDFREERNLFDVLNPFEARARKFRLDYLFQLNTTSAFRKDEIDGTKLNPEIKKALRTLGYVR
jgi:arylsulfatase A-like enzyme